MTEWQKKRMLRLIRLLETTAVLLFFYQALRALFSLLFGLIYDAVFAGQMSMAVVAGAMVVILLALVAPLAAPRAAGAQRPAMLAGAIGVFLARIALTFDHFALRLAASILIVAAAGLYLAVRLRREGALTAYGLVLALVVDQMLRAAGQTMDPTLRTAWWPGQVVVSLALCLVSAGLAWRRRADETPQSPGLGLRDGLVWAGWLFLQTVLLAFPNALARWSGESYLLFALCSPFVLLLTLLGSDLWRTRGGWIDGMLVEVVLLGGLIAGYLLGGIAAFLGLLMAQLAATIALFSTFGRRGEEGVEGAGQTGPEPAGQCLALGNVLFLLLHLAYAFTFTYPYTLEMFRGMGLPVVAIAALLAGLPLLWLPARDQRPSLPSLGRLFNVWGVGMMVIAFVLLVASPRRPAVAPLDGPLRALTYNIHYGYDDKWRVRLEDQARVIQGVDVVILQEVDTGRPTSYMIDDALWLARRLEMTDIYLPTMEHLTGIAVLSRYPVLEFETMLLPSALEQTGIIWVQVDAARPEVEGPVPLNVFGTWLGLESEERAQQLDAALPFLADHPGPAVFGGDFNARPDSPIYARIADAGFIDPFPALGLDPPLTDPALNPTKRIDFVWLRDLEPLGAWVPDSTASDHRPVIIKAALR